MKKLILTLCLLLSSLTGFSSEVLFDTSYSSKNFNSSPVSVDLKGDVYDYTIIFWCDAASGDSDLDVTLNSDTTANYRNYEMKGLSTTANAAVGDSDSAIELKNLLGTANPNFLMMTITGSSGDERYISATYAADGAILKQSSYWKDTANPLDEITFTGASSVTCDARIIIYQSRKVAYPGTWELVETKNFTSQNLNTTPITFSGLDGDAEKKYKVVIDGSTSHYRLRINADSGSNYLTQWLYNNSGSIAAFNFNDVAAYADPSNNIRFTLNAETGNKRLITTTQSGRPTANYDQVEMGVSYSNTATNVTSLEVSNRTGTSDTGTAKLYSLKTPNGPTGDTLPFETIQNISVSGDYSAGTTISNLAGNSQTLIKVEGHFSTIGNELRVQLAADTGANYDEQELKSATSSTSATSVSSANYWMMADASSSKVASFELYIYPIDGEVRPALLVNYTNENQIEYKAIWWDDTSTDLDSLKIYTSSTTATTGNIKVSRLR